MTEADYDRYIDRLEAALGLNEDEWLSITIKTP